MGSLSGKGYGPFSSYDSMEVPDELTDKDIAEIYLDLQIEEDDGYTTE